MESLLEGWIEQLKLLSTIAESDPKAAYSAFARGFKGKFIYFMRTIPEKGKLLKPSEDVLRLKFIPSITGGHICSDDERKLPLLPLFPKTASLDYESPKPLTTPSFQINRDQSKVYHVNEM